MRMRELLIFWVRWVLVLPAALITYWLTYMILSDPPFPLYELVTDANGAKTPLGSVIVWILCAFGCPIAFLCGGMLAAPKARYATCLVLTVLFAVGMGVSLTLAFVAPERIDLHAPLWLLVVDHVGQMATTIFICLQMRRHDVTVGPTFAPATAAVDASQPK